MKQTESFQRRRRHADFLCQALKKAQLDEALESLKQGMATPGSRQQTRRSIGDNDSSNKAGSRTTVEHSNKSGLSKRAPSTASSSSSGYAETSNGSSCGSSSAYASSSRSKDDTRLLEIQEDCLHDSRRLSNNPAMSSGAESDILVDQSSSSKDLWNRPNRRDNIIALQSFYTEFDDTALPDPYPPHCSAPPSSLQLDVPFRSDLQIDLTRVYSPRGFQKNPLRNRSGSALPPHYSQRVRAVLLADASEREPVHLGQSLPDLTCTGTTGAPQHGDHMVRNARENAESDNNTETCKNDGISTSEPLYATPDKRKGVSASSSHISSLSSPSSSISFSSPMSEELPPLPNSSNLYRAASIPQSVYSPPLATPQFVTPTDDSPGLYERLVMPDSKRRLNRSPEQNRALDADIDVQKYTEPSMSQSMTETQPSNVIFSTTGGQWYPGTSKHQVSPQSASPNRPKASPPKPAVSQTSDITSSGFPPPIPKKGYKIAHVPPFRQDNHSYPGSRSESPQRNSTRTPPPPVPPKPDVGVIGLGSVSQESFTLSTAVPFKQPPPIPPKTRRPVTHKPQPRDTYPTVAYKAPSIVTDSASLSSASDSQRGETQPSHLPNIRDHFPKTDGSWTSRSESLSAIDQPKGYQTDDPNGGTASARSFIVSAFSSSPSSPESTDSLSSPENSQSHSARSSSIQHSAQSQTATIAPTSHPPLSATASTVKHSRSDSSLVMDEIMDPKFVERQKVEEAIDKIMQRLHAYEQERSSLAEELHLNESMGRSFIRRLEEAGAGQTECDRVTRHIDEAGRIVCLQLRLNGQLARVEQGLAALPEAASEKDKRPFVQRKSRLVSEIDDARMLKQGIEAKSKAILSFLSTKLCDDDVRQYCHYMQMRERLLIDTGRLEDKIRLGEERIKALRCS